MGAQVFSLSWSLAHNRSATMAKIAVASSLIAAAVEAGSSLAQNSSQRSLLSQREGGLTSIGPPTLSGEYCGWSPHGDSNSCRLTFSGDKMHLEWRKDGHKKYTPCKGPPKEHQNCLAGIKRRLDCKNDGYKLVDWCKNDPTKPDVCYNVEWTGAGDKSDCITKAMGASKKSPSHVPLRIKVHDGSHLTLIEGKTQDGKFPDGVACNAFRRPNLPDGTSGCDGWNNHSHKPPCRRRAGCKSSGLPIPHREDADEEYDDEEFDLDDVLAEVV